jgi:hypothetical protein
LMPVALPACTKIYLALAPVDMRKGYDAWRRRYSRS